MHTTSAHFERQRQDVKQGIEEEEEEERHLVPA
jgi:hypothetical protein